MPSAKPFMTSLFSQKRNQFIPSAKPLMDTIFTSPGKSCHTCPLCEGKILCVTWSHWPEIYNVTPQMLLTYFLSRERSQEETRYPVKYSSVLAMRTYIIIPRVWVCFLVVECHEPFYSLSLASILPTKVSFQYRARVPASHALAWSMLLTQQSLLYI